MAKACASQGSRNTGPFSSRGMPGTASIAVRAAAGSIFKSRRLKVRLEGLDGHGERRIGVCAPQLAGVEDDRVEPLWILASARRHRVGEDMAAAHCFDHTDTVACVARQARVCRRIDVPRAHAIARLESRLTAG